MEWQQHHRERSGLKKTERKIHPGNKQENKKLMTILTMKRVTSPSQLQRRNVDVTLKKHGCQRHDVNRPASDGPAARLSVNKHRVEWSRATAAGFIFQFDFKSGPGTVSEGELKYRKYSNMKSFTVNRHNCRIEAKLTITFVSLDVLLIVNFSC